MRFGNIEFRFGLKCSVHQTSHSQLEFAIRGSPVLFSDKDRTIIENCNYTTYQIFIAEYDMEIKCSTQIKNSQYNETIPLY